MDNKVSASVVIPTHNRAYILKYSLKNILNQTADNYEVIVVDDASEDNTQELVSSLKDSTSRILKYIRLETHSGPYRARNIGIRQAIGEIIIFIDSDVIVYPKFVQDHIELHKHKSNLIVQGMVHHITFKSNLETKKLKHRYLLPNAIFWRLLVSQNTSVRKEWLMKTGLFDESLGPLIGFKDIELGIRLQELGLKFVHAFRSCKAYHTDLPYGKMRLQEYIKKHESRGASAYFFVKKHGRKAERIAHIGRTLFIAKLFGTEKWAEKRSTMKFICALIDSPILPLFPMWRGFVKYHYRAKGIKQAIREDAVSTISTSRMHGNENIGNCPYTE